MFYLKYAVLVSVQFLIQSVLSISSKSQNDTAEILWNLSNFAVQSRQNHPYPYSYAYPEKYPEYYQNYPVNSYTRYPGLNYHKLPYAYKPVYSQKLPSYPPGLSSTYPHQEIPKESFMDVLFSIARNDDLQCVPKLICEVTSGTISGRQQSATLPININTESIIGLLSAFSNVQASPLLHFGKAALLGYASKGNTGSCNYAYPDCPSDPDRVVQYLNNHNGGFFRYFNGVNAVQSHPQNYPTYYPEQRIQNNPVDYIPSTFREPGTKFPSRNELVQNVRSPKGLKFPSEAVNEVNANAEDVSFYKTQGPLKFPVEDDQVYYTELPFRKPKQLQFDHYSDNQLDLQRPLPNHKATPLIFPVRTGTGDLRLDADELEDYKQPYLYQDEDVKIVFNRFENGGKDVYNTNNDLQSSDYNRNGRGFSFPTL